MGVPICGASLPFGGLFHPGRVFKHCAKGLALSIMAPNHPRSPNWHQSPSPSPPSTGSMPFCVELDNLKDTDAPIHQPAAMLVAAD